MAPLIARKPPENDPFSIVISPIEKSLVDSESVNVRLIKGSELVWPESTCSELISTVGWDTLFSTSYHFGQVSVPLMGK